jgi:Uri superfamily endonuclease
MATPPKLPGTYAVILQADRHRELFIGSDGTFGTLQVQPGFYVYVGSAHGPGGLERRLDRHVRDTKKLKWHIDFLRAGTEVVETWWMEQEERRECDWVTAFGPIRGASVPMAKFGASDFRKWPRCPAHLYRFPQQPQVRTFRKHLAGVLGMPVRNVQTRVQRHV